jgi:cytochrome P450
LSALDGLGTPERRGVMVISILVRVHHCLGATLARLEGRVAVEELTRRYPRLEMAATPTRRPLLVLRGFESVPVRARD